MITYIAWVIAALGAIGLVTVLVGTRPSKTTKPDDPQAQANRDRHDAMRYRRQRGAWDEVFGQDGQDRNGD